MTMTNRHVVSTVALVFGLAGMAARAGNDAWPAATQATTQSCWRAAADGKFSSAANWQHIVDGKWTGEDGSVPVISSSEIVNGYLFNKASDYTVDVDSAATVNYLYAGQDYKKSEAGAVTLLVTNNLTFASPNASWISYRVKYGDVFATCQRQGLELNGSKVQMTVKDGAELKIQPVYLPETPNKSNYSSSDLGSIANGATLFVTNATLTLDNIRNNTYANQHHWFRLSGTESATSTLHLVDATLNYTGGFEDGSKRQPLHFSEYTRGIFTDTTMNMMLQDMQPTSASVPGPEILVNGNSVYRWQYSNYGTLQNGGHLVFDDTAKFEGDNTSSKYYYVGSSLEGGTCHLEFRGNSSANFNKATNAEELRIGNGCVNSLTTLDWNSKGMLEVWTALTVGLQYGEGRIRITDGLVYMGGYGNITLGKTDANGSKTEQCVTGRLDIANAVLSANHAAQNTVEGLVVGAAYNLRTADATDYYSYGEVNISGDSIVSNRSDVWVGTGFAKGVFRMTGGKFLSDNNLVLGAGGGVGEMYIFGGSYRICNAWEKGETTSDGHGAVYIGGISTGRMQAAARYSKLPTTFPHSRRGTGYLCVSNATFFVGEYGKNEATDIGSSGTGVLELKNGAYYKTSYLAMTNGANATLKFTLAGDTAPQMCVYGQAWIGPKSKLVVDANGYTGTEKWIQLVKFARDEYPNKYLQGWGTYRNGQPSDWAQLSSVCDKFDADCIETIGNVEIVQVTDSATQGRAAGIWAHVIRGMVILVL